MTKPATTQPHDAYFHHVFSRPELAAEVFREYLPQGLVEKLSWDRLTLDPTKRVSAKLRTRQSDLAFWVPGKKRSRRAVRLHLLLEHQSTIDRLMAFRLAEYIVGEWARSLQGVTRGKIHLPAIQPLVIFQGPGEWTAPRSLAGLLELPPGVGPEANSLNLNFNVVSLDRVSLPSHPEASIPLEIMREVARRDGAGIANALARFGETLSQSFNLPRVQTLLEATINYAFSSAPRLNYRRIMGQIENPEVVRKMETIAEYLEKKGRRVGHLKGRQEGRQEGRMEGRQEGRQEGRMEGRMEGRQQGLVESIIALLTARFGCSAASLSESLVRIDNFDALTKLLLQAPEVKSLKEFERAVETLSKESTGGSPPRSSLRKSTIKEP